MNNKYSFRNVFFFVWLTALLLLPMLQAAAGTVTTATGGDPILATTAATTCSPTWTPLSGPAYAESINGDLGNGDFTLNAPAGFEFNTASTVTIVLTQGDNTPAKNMNNVGVGSIVATATVTANSVSFTIFSKSQGTVLNTIQWRGIQVRPTTVTTTSGTITANGTSITNGGTGLIPTGYPGATSFGTLREVAATPTKLVVTLPGETFTTCKGNTGTPTSQTAGTAFGMTLTATDNSFNVIGTYTGTKSISYSGPTSACAIAPSYTTTVSFTNGVASNLSTTLRKAEAKGITASDGTISGPESSQLVVNPGALNKLVVTLPGETFTACAGNSGTVTDQKAGVAFAISGITATDSNYNIITGYTGTRNLSYSGPSGSPSYTTSVSFASGQSTTTLTTTLPVAETTTITVSDGTTSGPASSPLRVVAVASNFNAFETSTATTATSGVIKTKISGTGFNLGIVALTSTPTVSTGFTGTVKVELVDSSSTSSSCSTWPLVQSLPDQTFTTADQGRHTVSGISVTNAWKNVRVRISYPVTSPTIISCSTDNFAIRPSALIITVSDQDAQTAGTVRALDNTMVPGGTVHKAGRPFTIMATAQNSLGSTTTNYTGSPTATVSQCATTGGVCPSTLGTFSSGTWTASAGVVTSNTASYSDVGAFDLQLQDTTFAAVDQSDGSTTAERYIPSLNAARTSNKTTVGRFVPDHFMVSQVALTPRTDISACSGSSFTYMNEPFGTGFRLTAQNAMNVTTSNYDGALATLSASDPSRLNLAAVDSAANLTAPISGITQANPGQVTTSTAHGFTTGSKVYISGVNGMTGVNNALYTVTVVDANNFTIGVSTSTFGSYTSGGTASRLSVSTSNGSWVAGVADVTATVVLQRAVQPDGPFNLQIGIAPQDPDGIQLLAGALNLDADKNGTNERLNLGTMQSRFGRLALTNAHGSEVLNLPIPMQVQFWNGSSFQTNSQDGCTTIAKPNVILTNYKGGIDASNMTTSNVSIGGFNNGIGSLVLSKPLPRPTQKGSVDVTINLDAEAKTYLQGRWTSSTYNQNPMSRATFGIYKSGPVIYMREMY